MSGKNSLEYCRAYREANRKRIRAIQLKYSQSSKGKAARKAYAESHPEITIQSTIAWKSRNPEKKRIHTALNNAVQDGKVKKPKVCSKCGVEKRLDGHHPDYAKPLEVVWLCRPCHRAEHRS